MVGSVHGRGKCMAWGVHGGEVAWLWGRAVNSNGFLILPPVASDNDLGMRSWQLMSGLIAFWMFVLLYMTSSFFQSCEETERIERELNRAMEDLNALTAQNVQLQDMATELRYSVCVCVCVCVCAAFLQSSGPHWNDSIEFSRNTRRLSF